MTSTGAISIVLGASISASRPRLTGVIRDSGARGKFPGDMGRPDAAIVTVKSRVFERYGLGVPYVENAFKSAVNKTYSSRKSAIGKHKHAWTYRMSPPGIVTPNTKKLRIDFIIEFGRH